MLGVVIVGLFIAGVGTLVVRQGKTTPSATPTTPAPSIFTPTPTPSVESTPPQPTPSQKQTPVTSPTQTSKPTTKPTVKPTKKPLPTTGVGVNPLGYVMVFAAAVLAICPRKRNSIRPIRAR